MKTSKYKSYLQANIILMTIFLIGVNDTFAQYQDFKSNLYEHLKNTHIKFSVFYDGSPEPFLNDLQSLVTAVVDSVVAENVVIKSYNYSTRYSSSRARVSFNVEYASTANEIFVTEKELTEFVFQSLSEYKEYFEAGLKWDGITNPQRIGERIFEAADSLLRETFHQVRVSTYECNFTSFENYLQFKFGIIYVLPELLSGDYAYSNGELVPIIYKNLLLRKQSFPIHLLNHNERYNVFAAYQISLENDEYLLNSIKSMSFRSINFASAKIVVFDVEYLSSPEEEEIVELETDKILTNLITADMNSHEKIKAVHDYIILNVAYDDSKEYDNAYEAIMEKKAVCNGYTLLAEKLFHKLGFETRIVNSPEMKHTWNMIKVEGEWYHIDLTWNDPVPDVKGRILYDFFMVSDRGLNWFRERTHTWNRSEYPVANSSYPYHYDNVLLNNKSIN